MDHAFPPYYKDAKCRGVDFYNETEGLSGAPVMNLNGTRSTDIFVQEFARILEAHPDDTPLYVYFAFQNAHDPYEHAPENLVAEYDARMDVHRRNFSAMRASNSATRFSG